MQICIPNNFVYFERCLTLDGNLDYDISLLIYTPSDSIIIGGRKTMIPADALQYIGLSKTPSTMLMSCINGPIDTDLAGLEIRLLICASSLC